MSDAFGLVLLIGWFAGCMVMIGISYYFVIPKVEERVRVEVTAEFQQDLINRGLALYCPQTGEFAFNDECDGN